MKAAIIREHGELDVLMLHTVQAAGLKPVIDSVFPLDQAREAMGRMERGEQFGKVVLRVP